MRTLFCQRHESEETLDKVLVFVIDEIYWQIWQKSTRCSLMSVNEVNLHRCKPFEVLWIVES